MPLVSVIIPTYNYADYISEAIDSVLAQTYKDYEVIVIDDGSTDNTKEILSKYNGKIRYFYQENKGLSAARNKGIKEARGEYIAFLDSDDIWLPEKLELQLNLLSSRKECSWAYCNRDCIFEQDSKKIPFREYAGYEGDIFGRLFINIFLLPSTIIVKRYCFNEVGNFNEKLYHSEDYDLFLRLAKKYHIAYVNKQLVLRRVHFASACRTKQELGFVTRLQVLKKCVKNNYSYFRKKKNIVNTRFGILHYKMARFYFLASSSKIKIINEFLKTIWFRTYIIKSILGIMATLLSDIKIVRDRMKKRWEWNYEL